MGYQAKMPFCHGVTKLDHGQNVTYFKELDRLDADDTVYKLVGPVLVKQDLTESKQNIAKRIEYITAEM